MDALLEQVAATLGAVLEQRQGVGGAGVLAEDDDADLGCVSRRRRATLMPSSSPVGGIRMSTMTTSGGSASIAASSASPSAKAATRSTPSIDASTSFRASRIRIRVVGEKDADRPLAISTCSGGSFRPDPGARDERADGRVGRARRGRNQAGISPDQPATFPRRPPEAGLRSDRTAEPRCPQSNGARSEAEGAVGAVRISRR